MQKMDTSKIVKDIKLPRPLVNLRKLSNRGKNRFQSPVDELCRPGNPCYTSKISYVQPRQASTTTSTTASTTTTPRKESTIKPEHIRQLPIIRSVLASPSRLVLINRSLCIKVILYFF